MKIRNYLTILFATLAILFLLGLAGYLTYENADDANPVKQTIASIFPGLPSLSSSTSQATEAAQTEQTEAASSAPAVETASTVPAHSIVFVGDSRTVSMGEAVQDSCTYLGKEGEGYQWFADDGIFELRTLLENDPSQTIVYNLGVNDPENMNLYIELYQSIAREFTDTPFYYLSVNPLSDDAQCNTTNDMIQEFNQALKAAFPDHYLDCYDYLTEQGYDTVDGLHYTEATSNLIHNYVVEQVLANA